MYKKLLSVLILMPSIANAAQNVNEHFPSTTRGFHVKPTSQEKIKTAMHLEKEYMEKSNEDQSIRFFLTLKSRAPSEIKEFKNNKDVGDTHLKSNLSEIKLSIPFEKISAINDNEIIGYAAIGSYEKGWSGVRVFFERQELGICSYSFERFLAIQAEESKIKYIINNKPSFKNIEGNYNTGFIYTLSWDDDKKTSVYDHKLECVNKNMNKNIMDRMIVLANNI